MLLTFVFVLALCIQDRTTVQCCQKVEDTELMMAFLVHRHGDRAAKISEIFLSEDPDELARKSHEYGFGHLTDAGKIRSFILGKFLRRRYNQFLSAYYNSSDIFVRSTETSRTQMTAKIAFTAAYSSRAVWSDDMELIPLEMKVTPASEDPNSSTQNCRVFKSFLFGMLTKDKFPKDMQIYDELMEKLSENMIFNLHKNPLSLYGKLSTFASEESVGMPLSEVDLRLLPTLRQGAGIAASYLYGKQHYVPLQAGVLLKEFFDTADQIISGANIPRLRVLSAHDFNVYAFTAATRAVPKQGVPRYCSVYALELRRCKESGKYFVVPVYVKTPEEPEVYLEIEDCGVICGYEKFRELTVNNVMTEEQYRTRCLMDDPGSPVEVDDVLFARFL